MIGHFCSCCRISDRFSISSMRASSSINSPVPYVQQKGCRLSSWLRRRFSRHETMLLRTFTARSRAGIVTTSKWTTSLKIWLGLKKTKSDWILKKNLVNKNIVLFFQRLRFSIGHNFTQPSLVLFLFYSPSPPSSSSIETEEERKRKKERKKGICIYGNLHGGGWGILASGTKRLSKIN